jgi:hypothetical protein
MTTRGDIRLRPGRLPATELAVPNRRKRRVRKLVERAEVLFVRQVVQDGGIASWRRQVQARVRAARDACVEGRVASTETAALVVALVDVPVRDACAWLVADEPDRSWVTLWLHLVRHAPPPFRAEPLFLLGWTAWRLGDLPLAAAAVAEARREEPGHRASVLLAQLLAADHPPAVRRRGA